MSPVNVFSWNVPFMELPRFCFLSSCAQSCLSEARALRVLSNTVASMEEADAHSDWHTTEALPEEAVACSFQAEPEADAHFWMVELSEALVRVSWLVQFSSWMMTRRSDLAAVWIFLIEPRMWMPVFLKSSLSSLWSRSETV